jgi:hypothetical protein
VAQHVQVSVPADDQRIDTIGNLRVWCEQNERSPLCAVAQPDVALTQADRQAFQIYEKGFSRVEINRIAGRVGAHPVRPKPGQNRLQPQACGGDLYGRIEERQINHTLLWNRRDRRRRGTPSFWSAPP